MKKIIIFKVIILLTIIMQNPSCKKDLDLSSRNHPAHQLKNYSFNAETELISRVKPAPDFVMAYLKKMDSRDDYTAYTPSMKERTMIQQYLEEMPPLTKKVLKKSLIGIYFISNFWGSGLADWVIDRNGKMFSFIVSNSEVFNSDLSYWLTYRENSCFKRDNPDIEIRIDCGKKYTGLMYALLHESTHVVDYVMNITPYVEDATRKIAPSGKDKTLFTEGIWKGIKKPETIYDYPFRKSITFYGFGKGPKISIYDSAKVYRALSRTPFVSLYGSTSWAEDIAEYIFLYHLTRHLKQPYRILVTKKGKSHYSYEPMKSEGVIKRYKTIERFYR